MDMPADTTDAVVAPCRSATWCVPNSDVMTTPGSSRWCSATWCGSRTGWSASSTRCWPASPGFATIRKRLVDAGEFELADVDGGIEISIQTRPEMDCRRLHFPSGRSPIASMMPGTPAPRMRELPMASGMRKWLALSMQRSPTAP